MAIMELDKRMVFWKITIDETPVTKEVGHYVKSIDIKTSILPSKSQKEEKSPYEAKIAFTSENYIEDWFTPGRRVKIYMGYDRVYQPLVFSGVIHKLPDGNAKELLNYTVKIVGDAMLLTLEKKRRTFIPERNAAVLQILSGYEVIPVVTIEDATIIPAKYTPTQNNETDMQCLNRFAKFWGCSHWYQFPNFYYFLDTKNAHLTTSEIVLGYRTDKFDKGLPVSNNVETVKWSHKPGRAALAINPGILGFNEEGEKTGKAEYNISAPDDEGKWQTWELRPEVWRAAEKDWGLLFKYSFIATTMTFSLQGYEALKKYYKIVEYSDANDGPAPPAGDAGYEFEITLNEGDPEISPPANVRLYAGTGNPKTGMSHLPQWLYRYGKTFNDAVILKLNTVEHSFNGGRLKTVLKCTVGMFT